MPLIKEVFSFPRAVIKKKPVTQTGLLKHFGGSYCSEGLRSKIKMLNLRFVQAFR